MQSKQLMKQEGKSRDENHDKEVLEEKEFMKMVEHEMQTGEHIKSPDSAYRGIGNSHFHSVEELEAELDAAGFIDNEVHDSSFAHFDRHTCFIKRDGWSTWSCSSSCT